MIGRFGSSKCYLTIKKYVTIVAADNRTPIHLTE